MVSKMNLTGETRSEEMVDIVGIDLGTTNCAVSIFTAGTVPTLLPIGEKGKYTLPSCVKWIPSSGKKNPEFVVGMEAYRERFMSDVVYSVKRIMGSGKKVTFIDRDDSNNTLEMTPAQVSGVILRSIKDRVCELHKSVEKCVITVPAYFNVRQIEDTLEAARLSGWDCVQILKEPTSASYIYSHLGYASGDSVLIYDLGGGTFDVTHMNFLRRDSIPSKMLTSLKRQYGINLDSIKNADINAQYFCRVLGTYGDVNLGGDDIDARMADIIIHDQHLNLTPFAREELILKCEEFKKMGIYGMDAEIDGQKVKFIMKDLNTATDFVFAKTLKLMDDIDMSSIKAIVLVGGSTKSERIRSNLENAFPNAEISSVLDPDASVALGAGSVAKAVANNSKLSYADVLPLPIGVVVDDTRVDVCIEKNTSMPYSMIRQFHTVYDNQERVRVQVVQGTSLIAKECTLLGTLIMEDIPRKPAGEVFIDVSFILNSQGQLKITSTIDGVEKEEHLVIDDLLSVSKEQNSEAKVAEESIKITLAGWEYTAQDNFEKSFFPLLPNTKKVAEKVEERRRQLQSGENTQEIEISLVEDATSVSL